MSEFKKLQFIINKFSGTGFRPKLEGRILNACEQHQAECTIEFTVDRGHATTIARNAIGKFDAVIAVGGDGTVNETARGLLHSETPLGILPRGSGNGLARHLGIPMDTAAALTTMFNSKVLKMDTFHLNGGLSVNVSGIGFDGHIANLFGKGQKRGFWGYARHVIKEYTASTGFEARLVQGTNETPLKDSFILAIANSSQYGNNAWVSPASSVTDGELNLVHIKKISLLKGIAFARMLFTKRLRNNALYHFRAASQLVIKTDNPVAFHIDGEPGGVASHFDIRIDPASLAVLVPEKNLTSI